MQHTSHLTVLCLAAALWAVAHSQSSRLPPKEAPVMITDKLKLFFPCSCSWQFIRGQCAHHQLSPEFAPAACRHPSRSTGTSSSSVCCALQALLVFHQAASRPPAQPSMCTSCLPASLKIYWHRQRRSVGLMQGPCCTTRPTSGPKRAEG